jgi:predicted acetyltransferase
VRCAGTSGEPVAPQARGRGLGRALFARTLDDLAEGGVALAPLYPSDARVYRSWGWEFVAATALHRMPVIGLTVPRGAPAATEWGDDADLALVDACQRRLARVHDGALLRTPLWWRQRFLGEPAEDATYRYLVRRGDDVAGYLIYRQKPPGSPDGRSWQWDLSCAEMSWEDAAARDAILALLADQAPSADRMIWAAPEADTLGGRARMELSDPVATLRWMTRIVCVRQALELRGYPEGLETELALTVHDPLCDRNSGAFRLSIGAGRGTVERVPTAAAELDIRTLATLYTGAATPWRAAALGDLTGASEHDLHVLARAFGGRELWMADLF